MLNFLLMNAAVLGKVGAVQWLLRLGADPNACDRSWMGVECVDEDGRSMGRAEPRQHLMTVLMGTVSAGRVEVVRVLTEAGADVNARDAEGRTPLMHAVIMDEAAVAEVLLARGADVNARDARGRTVLALALQLERMRVLPVLERAGARLG